MVARHDGAMRADRLDAAPGGRRGDRLRRGYGVRAELLATYFPAGVPGYGTAPGVTVASRLHPDFDPSGVRVGSFLLHPQIEEGLGYDGNLFGSGSGALGSWLVGTHPSLLIGSDWSRNSLSGYVGADDLRYLDQPPQSYTNWTASLGVRSRSAATSSPLAAAHFGLHQPRTELDALPSDTPVAYRVDDVRASYRIALDRLSMTPTWRSRAIATPRRRSMARRRRRPIATATSSRAR